MKKVFPLIIVLVILLLVAMNLHFVKTDSSLVVMRKESMTLEDTYVNVTKWKADDFREHPYISRELMKRGYEELVGEAQKELGELWDNLKTGVDNLFGK
jgi:phosphoglycerol transferase MdoB-like AlkP superfamily enzyme